MTGRELVQTHYAWLQNQPPRSRLVTVLHYAHDVSDLEIANMIGVSEDQIPGLILKFPE